MENLHLKNIDQYANLKTPKQAQNFLLYNLLQISNNKNNIHNITKYIKPELFTKVFPNIKYCYQLVNEDNIEYILDPIQKYLFELFEQNNYFQINKKEKLNNILNEYNKINHALKNIKFSIYPSDVYNICRMKNEVILKYTVNKHYRPDKYHSDYQSFKEWIYMDSVQEIINNKFKIIKYFIPKNIYVELIRIETNKISTLYQNISPYDQEILIQTIYITNLKNKFQKKYK